MLRICLSLCGCLLLSACSPSKPGSSPPDTQLQLQRAADQVLDAYFERYPLEAVELGLHQFDGQLRDTSAAALEAERAALRGDLDKLRAIEAKDLTAFERAELALLITELDAKLFEIEVSRSPWLNPMFYTNELDLTPYISRDYAPLGQRADAVIASARAGVELFEHAAQNLELSLPRPFIETALLQIRGTLSFLVTDVPAAFSGLDDHARALALADALAGLADALRDFEALLVERQASATDEFALGPERLVEMLARTQGIELDLATLRELARAELARNLAELEQVAAQIDPHQTPAEVVAMIAADKPQHLLEVASEQVAMVRQFLIDHELASIPGSRQVIVAEAPSFARWNIAFTDIAGPYETSPLPSFYYIAPPDPSWTPEQQREYLLGTADLLFTSVHEIWPGHFLQALHTNQNPSRTLRSLSNYAASEGWAHYAEQMMADAGLADDPQLRVGYLQNALLRSARFVVALELHAGDMTVDEAAELFETEALQDPMNARQQAVRGTFDPMYLTYTLGKLIILELRNDWQAQQRAAGADDGLRRFHDELLSYGAAPLPAIREAMVD